jgi:hypothetical protein
MFCHRIFLPRRVLQPALRRGVIEYLIYNLTFPTGRKLLGAAGGGKGGGGREISVFEICIMFIFTLPTNPLQAHTIRSHRQRLIETGAIVKGPALPTMAAIIAPSWPLSWSFCSLCSRYIKRACLCMQGWSTWDDDKWKVLTTSNITFPLRVRSKYTDIYPNFKFNTLFVFPHFIYYIRIKLTTRIANG